MKIIAVFVVTLLSLCACSNFASVVRKATYPPEFKYVSGDELRGNMQKLAFRLQELDLALNSLTPDQQAVLESLRQIERIGSSMQAGEAGSNHPFLEDYMQNFVSQVSQAKQAAALNPPRYYRAGQVAGGCLSCHKVNRF